MEILSEEGGALNFTASIGTDLFFSERDKLSQGLRSLTGEANAQTASVENLYKKAASAIATYASLTAGAQLIQNIIKVRGEFEQLGVAFETMLGSKQKADALMSQVVKFAATTPFQLTEVAQTTKQLLAYGVAADDIEGTLRSLGDVASGISAPLGDIAYLYGTIKTAGVALTQDVRQFANRGIPIYTELAKVLHVNVNEVGDFITAGKVGFPQIEQAFKNLTGAGSQFGGLMAKQSETLTGVLANLSDSIDQVYNDIGKSNSGIAYSVIGFANTAVENYQKILDVLKVAVTVYGSYRAALLLAVAAERLQQEAMLQTALAGKELTGVQAGLAAAQRLIQGSAKGIFDAFTKALPTAGITAGIAALGVVIYSLTQITNGAAEAQKTLAVIETDAAKAAVSQSVQVNTLVSILKDKKSTHEQTITALNKLRDTTGPYLKNYSDEEILAGKASGAIKNYIQSINDLAKAQAAKNKLIELQEQLIDIENKAPDAVDKIDALGQSLKNTFFAGDYSKPGQGYFDLLTSGQATEKNYFDNKKNIIQAQIDAITGKYGESLKQLALGGDALSNQAGESAAKLSNKQLVDTAKSLEDLDTLRKKISDSYQNANDQANRDALTSDLKYLDARKKAFDTFGADKVTAKTNEEAINKVNSLYEKQKSLLEQINALHHDAIQSGLLKQESELDKVNEKYDGILQSIKQQNDLYDKISQKYPGGITAYNKANPDNQVQRIDQSTINKVNADRTIETNNSNYKQDADEYLKHLDDQKKIFEQYQESIKQIGIDRANELYAAQTKGFTNYVDYLKDQQDKLKVSSAVSVLFGGLPDIGTQTKLKGVGEAQVAATKEANDKQYDDTKANYTRIITLTNSFDQQRKNLDDKYETDRKQLAATYKGEDLQARLAALKDYYDQEKKQVDISATYQTDIYKKLNENILLFTKEQLQQRIKDFKDALDNDSSLTPAMRQAIQGSIDQLQGLVIATDKTQEKITKLLTDAGKLQGAFSNLSTSLQGVNKDLAEVAGSISAAISTFSSVMQGMKDFDAAKLKGDAAGQIAASVNIAASILSAIDKEIALFKEAQQSRKDAAASILKFQTDTLTGELAYNALLRERERTQSNITDLTAQQLKDQQAILETQKQQAQQAYNDLLLKIQQSGKQITGEHTEKTGNLDAALTGGLIGAIFGGKTKTVQDLAGLSDADYDELEKLFTEGKLDETTKAWFTSLQSVHDEISGIGASSQEIADKLNEIYTGTTSDALADSITEGFKKGYSSIYDFGDTINDVVRNALFSAFEANVIKPAMQPLYDELAQLASDGLDAFDITKFTTDANTTLAPLIEQAKSLQESLNASVNSSSSDQNSLIGAQSQATEQTNALLAGQFGALRLTAAQQYQVASQTLIQITLIANYTADIPNVKAILADMQNRGVKIRA